MSARDIIAEVFGQLHRETCYPDASSEEKALAADAVMIALISSGYRILAPGEMDRETLEAAAKVADRGVPIGDKDSKVECFSCNHEVIADAIRALGGVEG